MELFKLDIFSYAHFRTIDNIVKPFVVHTFFNDIPTIE